MLISNAFLKRFLPKITQIPDEGIFVSSRNFAIALIRGCRFQTWEQFFKILAQKYPNKALLVPNLGIFVTPHYFAIRQILGLLISNMAIVLLKLYPKNTNIRHFWSKWHKPGILVSKLGIFVFSRNFRFRECWFQIRQYCFQIPAQKYPKLGPKVRHLCFFTKCCNYTNSRVLISDMTLVFWNSSRKIPKWHFWSQM